MMLALVFACAFGWFFVSALVVGLFRNITGDSTKMDDPAEMVFGLILWPALAIYLLSGGLWMAWKYAAKVTNDL